MTIILPLVSFISIETEIQLQSPWSTGWLCEGTLASNNIKDRFNWKVLWEFLLIINSMWFPYLQIARVTVAVVNRNTESGVLCCHSANPAEKPMSAPLPIPMPSPALRWELRGACSSPLLLGVLELCAPSSSLTSLPIISPIIFEQGIVFNLHTRNEKSVGNYTYHIPWWK